VNTKLTYREREKLFRAAWIIVFLILAWLIFSPWGAIRYYLLHSKLAAINAGNLELQQTNQNLLEEIERLKTDPEYIEEIARKKYGLIKRNEVIYQFPRQKGK